MVPFSSDTQILAVPWTQLDSVRCHCPAPVVTMVHVTGREGYAYTKWLGHPLMHVLLRAKARRNPR